MAITSAYIINEEQDGFVAVDFDFINDQDRHDLTAWEFVDQVGADVDGCSEEGDGVSDSVESAGSDVETVGEDVESLPEYFDGEDDDCGRSDDVSETVGFAGSDVLEECLSGRIAGGDVKSVPETIFSPEYSENIVGEYENSVTESIILPEYVTDRIADYSDSVTAYGLRSENYCFEEEEVEEDDYDLDDELVPYYVNGKLGRERMRKLGKRSCTKLIKSKRLTYNYNKPGCFRGKHGLGLKHSLM